MTSTPEQHLVQRYETSLVDTFANFQDSSQEWRRLFSELLGTFFLVLVAAGGGMMGQAFPDTISRTAAVVAPGLMVMGDHLVHGQGVGRTSQPGGQHRVLAARRLPVEARAGLHRRAARRRHARRLVPASRDRRLGDLRFELSGERDSRPATRS